MSIGSRAPCRPRTCQELLSTAQQNARLLELSSLHYVYYAKEEVMHARVATASSPKGDLPRRVDPLAPSGIAETDKRGELMLAD